jgi:hypothetical protein
MQQSSSLSERQILALTLHISYLDSILSRATRPAQNLSDEVSSTNDPVPDFSNAIRPSSSAKISASVHCRAFRVKKRSVTSFDVSVVDDGSREDLSSTCAKCRRMYKFICYPLSFLTFCYSSTPTQWHASPQETQFQ